MLRPTRLALALVFLLGCHRGLSAQDRQAFLGKCEKTQSETSCRCVLGALEKTLTPGELRALSDPGVDGRAPPPAKMAKVRDAVMACEPAAR